jgi:hypothetical protein
MPTLTFSDVFYDLTWKDVGEMLSMSEDMESMDCRVTHDTSGGTRSNGTEYGTETVFSAEYEYQLGDGQVSLDGFTQKLSQVPALPNDVSALKSEIKQRT